MRRLPKFLRIGGFRLPVVVVDNLTFEVEGHGDEDVHAMRAYGLFDPNQLDISIDRANGIERTKGTLMHEVLHVAINVARLQMPHEDEEEFVSRMAPLMLDFLRQNKAAVSYLQEN